MSTNTNPSVTTNGKHLILSYFALIFKILHLSLAQIYLVSNPGPSTLDEAFKGIHTALGRQASDWNDDLNVLYDAVAVVGRSASSTHVLNYINDNTAMLAIFRTQQDVDFIKGAITKGIGKSFAPSFRPLSFIPHSSLPIFCSPIIYVTPLFRPSLAPYSKCCNQMANFIYFLFNSFS
jgi:hypothetical protein